MGHHQSFRKKQDYSIQYTHLQQMARGENLLFSCKKKEPKGKLKIYVISISIFSIFSSTNMVVTASLLDLPKLQSSSFCSNPLCAFGNEIHPGKSSNDQQQLDHRSFFFCIISKCSSSSNRTIQLLQLYLRCVFLNMLGRTSQSFLRGAREANQHLGQWHCPRLGASPVWVLFCPYPPTPNIPVRDHWCRLRLHLSLAPILCELRRARVHAQFL